MWRKLLRRVVCYKPDGVPDGGAPVPDGQGDPTPATPPAPENPGITLSRSEYGQLMGTIASLQQKLEAQEPTPQAQPQLASEDVDRMTNSQFQAHMLNLVQSQVGQPLLNSIMTLAVKEELRDTQAKYPDFSTMKDEVYTEAQANTHLSLEQAYLIVKARKTGTAPPVAPKPAPAAPVGTKPGVTPSTTTPTTNLSTREAALAAFKSLQGN